MPAWKQNKFERVYKFGVAYLMQKRYKIVKDFAATSSFSASACENRITTLDKTCWDTLQEYLFFALTLTKMLTITFKRLLPPSPIAMCFAVTHEMHA